MVSQAHKLCKFNHLFLLVEWYLHLAPIWNLSELVSHPNLELESLGLYLFWLEVRSKTIAVFNHLLVTPLPTIGAFRAVHHLEALNRPGMQIEPARLLTAVSLRFVTISLLDLLHGGVVGEAGPTSCPRNHQSCCYGVTSQLFNFNFGLLYFL
jgi:hypothetical protein